MKKIVVTIFVMFCCVFAYAQQTETELIRSAFKLEKKALVAQFLALKNEDAAKFWPLYDKYELERSELNTRRIKLIDTYATKYESMDDASTDALVKESAAIQKKEVALREKYYGTVKKSVSTNVAARFYQIEDAINVGVRMELFSQIPMLNP